MATNSESAPRIFLAAIALLWLSLAVSVVSGYIAYVSLPIAFVMWWICVSLMLKGLLFLMISLRRNWARIAYAVLVAFAVLALWKTGPSLVTDISHARIRGWVGLTDVVFQVVALCLLFAPANSDWIGRRTRKD
jgi:FtsH-binding integral membrane protein